MKLLQLSDLFPEIELTRDIIKFKQYGFIITEMPDGKPALNYPFYDDDILDESFKFEISEENLFELVSNLTTYNGKIQKNLIVIENDEGKVEVIPYDHKKIKRFIKENKIEPTPGSQVFDVNANLRAQIRGEKKVYFGKIKNIFNNKILHYFGIYNRDNQLIDTTVNELTQVFLLERTADVNLADDKYSQLSRYYSFV